MRKLILIVMILFLAVSVQAATLRFDPAERAEGYIVYYTDGSEMWSSDIGDRTSVDLVEFNLTPGTWTFSVTAYNTAGLGPESDTVDWSISAYTPEDNPKPITIIIPGSVTITINGD